ncbi:MAG: NACHT domain-containing protein [Myxacorys californica WJT36-NPBG1]|jgi:hypothetical protein|nr:NACHT domain-containing protein [Myxacorys californica WJT36-NPBG1]
MWTPDPILLEVIKKLTSLVIDTVWKQSGEKITEQLQKQVGNAIEKYVRTYEERHCTLKYACLRMDDSLRLEEIYTDVQVLEPRELRYFQSNENLEDLFRELGRGFQFEKTTRQAGIAVANQFPRLVVLGSPGIGKSTFLKKVGLEALKWETSGYRHEVIPVLLELKRFDASQTDIEKFIAAEFEECGFPEAATFTQRMLAAGKLLVLLDGLDEVTSHHVDRAIVQIGNLVDRYDENRFITSCRIAAYKGGFPRFKDVTMANFDDRQIKTFIDRWFHREPKLADQCWETLKSPEYAAAKELGQTPLLLTLLCAVYSESLTFPKRRATLYGEALEVWLKNWATERRVHRDPIYRDLCLEDEQILLSEIAYKSLSEQQLFFSKKELTKQIKAFLTSTLNAPKHLDAEAVLKAIQIQQGILVERARNQYSFSHLTFQEYLTAQYIVEEGLLEELVKQHLTSRSWREVFLLVSGSLRSADQLLVLMARETRKLVGSENLYGLVLGSSLIAADSEDNYNSASNRAVAIFIALSHDKTYHQNLALKLVSALDSSRKLGRLFKFVDELAGHFIIYRSVVPTSTSETSFQALLETVYMLAEEIEKAKVFRKSDSSILFEQLRILKDIIPDDRFTKQKSIEEYSEITEIILQSWCNYLCLAPEWVDLPQREVFSLRDYLYANELIVQCRDAGRVSPQVWNAIESRMLTMRDD